MRGEFLKTALYCAGVVSMSLGAIAEKISQHSCVRGSVWLCQPVHQWFHMAFREDINNFFMLEIVFGTSNWSHAQVAYSETTIVR